jgi:exosome complex component CSL4
MVDKRVVYPGDELGTSEEFMAGDGTYEKDGMIFAANIGELEFDDQTRSATVKPLTSMPVTLKIGDTVIGIVTDIRSSMAFVNIIKLEGINRQISSATQGSIHVSKISKQYLDDVRRGYWIGDILRAKVIKAEPALQLSTEGSELGVIKSFCKLCQEPLVMKNNDVYCETCDRPWQKKTSDDYRQGQVR